MTSAPTVVAPAQSRTVLRTKESGDFLMSEYLGEYSDSSETGRFQATDRAWGGRRSRRIQY